jgi:hypothetical protein
VKHGKSADLRSNMRAFNLQLVEAECSLKMVLRDLEDVGGKESEFFKKATKAMTALTAVRRIAGQLPKIDQVIADLPSV